MVLFHSLKNPCKNLDYLHHLGPAFPSHYLSICISSSYRSPFIAVLCTTAAGMYARPLEVIHFFLQSLNYIHSWFFFSSTQLLKYITITYTVRTEILHHPACHIPCSRLSPHFYHLSVPSGTRSSYQWYGASALSGVKSRSRWEGWCWKDSRQGR